MTPIVVSNPAALAAALKVATAGAVILLSPGRWEHVSISDVVTHGEITLKSQDLAHPAILPSLVVKRSEGLNFSDMTFATELFNPPTSNWADAPFKVLNSTRIKLNRLNIHGTLDGNPRDDVDGLLISDSSYVTLANSEFQQFHVALIEYRTDHLDISDNKFHDIRVDGIDNSGSSFVNIVRNSFSDFYPIHVGGAGDHPDAIQFWTQNTKAPAHDITVSGNIFDRGRGLAVQGIFITDQIGIPYQRVTIAGNTIRGGMYNGIMVQGCSGLTIIANTIQPYFDMTSWIRVEKSDDVNINNNHAGSFLYRNNGKITENHNEKTFPVASPFGKAPSDDP